MRTTLTALLLCGALSSSAQWTLPAAPDTMSIYMTYAGNRLVSAGQMRNVGLGTTLLGAVLCGVAATVNSDRDVVADGPNPLYLAGGACFVAGITFQFVANEHEISAGRNLRRRKR